MRFNRQQLLTLVLCSKGIFCGDGDSPAPKPSNASDRCSILHPIPYLTQSKRKLGETSTMHSDSDSQHESNSKKTKDKPDKECEENQERRWPKTDAWGPSSENAWGHSSDNTWGRSNDNAWGRSNDSWGRSNADDWSTKPSQSTTQTSSTAQNSSLPPKQVSPTKKPGFFAIPDPLKYKDSSYSAEQKQNMDLIPSEGITLIPHLPNQKAAFYIWCYDTDFSEWIVGPFNSFQQASVQPRSSTHSSNDDLFHSLQNKSLATAKQAAAKINGTSNVPITTAFPEVDWILQKPISDIFYANEQNIDPTAQLDAIDEIVSAMDSSIWRLSIFLHPHVVLDDQSLPPSSSDNPLSPNTYPPVSTSTPYQPNAGQQEPSTPSTKDAASPPISPGKEEPLDDTADIPPVDAVDVPSADAEVPPVDTTTPPKSTSLPPFLLDRITLLDLFDKYDTLLVEHVTINQQKRIAYLAFAEEGEYQNALTDPNLLKIGTPYHPKTKMISDPHESGELYFRGFLSISGTVTREEVFERIQKDTKIRKVCTDVTITLPKKLAMPKFSKLDDWLALIQADRVRKTAPEQATMIVVPHLFDTNAPEVFKFHISAIPKLCSDKDLFRILKVSTANIITASIVKDIKTGNHLKYGFVWVFGLNSYKLLLANAEKFKINGTTLKIVPARRSKKKVDKADKANKDTQKT